MYDELFNSDDEDDIILNQAYNAVSKQSESEWEKVEEVNGEISESE